jgi:hypothetical protein
MKSISAWSATVQDDIAQSEPLIEISAGNFTFRAHNTGDSFWIVCEWPGTGRIAFRTAFAQQGAFGDVKISEAGDTTFFTMTSAAGSFEVAFVIGDKELPCFRYRTTFRPAQPLLIPYAPRDIVPLSDNGDLANLTGKVHTQQIGTRTGQMFFSLTRPKTGSVFYFQNLSSLNQYCQATHTSAGNCVGGSWPEIGFALPVTNTTALPARHFVISDAFVIPSAEIPNKAYDIARHYMDALAKIYLGLPRPYTMYRDWPEISQNALHDITHGKGCWLYTSGHSYLNAYHCDYATPPEVMVQLAVLTALKEYENWSGEEIKVIPDIEAGLQSFYDDKLKTICRWLPAKKDDLDGSEPQKKPLVMDSWYLHHPLINLSKLALDGHDYARKLLLGSIDFAITVAHHFDYEWPVFYKMDTLETVKKETAPGRGGEKDVGGGYAQLMLNMWKLTDDKKYFREAVRAAKKLNEFGLEVFYQANTTACAALALLTLYAETKKIEFLQQSYACIAAILTNVQLWECEYGHASTFPDFFGIFPLRDAPYKAPYEELEAYAALNEYLKEAHRFGIEILPSVKLLISEMGKYALHRLPFYYPPMLPKEIISETVKTGEIAPELWIPLEDLYDGWEKNGQVGQEVYGAGIGFGVVPRQYIKLSGGRMLYTEYPIANLSKQTRRVGFTLLGDERLKCRVRIFSQAGNEKFTLKAHKQRIEPKRRGEKYTEYNVDGNAAVTLTW